MKLVLQWRLIPGKHYATTLRADHSWTPHCHKIEDRRKCQHCRYPRRTAKWLNGNDGLFQYRVVEVAEKTTRKGGGK